MRYSLETTNNHPLAEAFPNCMQSIESIIQDEGYDGPSPIFRNQERAIDLDDAEELIADCNNRACNQSMDMAFGVIDNKSNYSKIIMVEFKFRMTNPNTLNRQELEGKVDGSINALGNQIEIYNKYFIIVQQNLIEQARSRLARMFPPIRPNFIPHDVASLHGFYF